MSPSHAKCCSAEYRARQAVLCSGKSIEHLPAPILVAGAHRHACTAEQPTYHGYKRDAVAEEDAHDALPPAETQVDQRARKEERCV